MRVVWTKTAQEHLDEIYHYIEDGIEVIAVLHDAQNCLRSSDG